MAEKPTPRPGKTFGDYELQKRLGKGSMSEVFLARHTSTNQIVAVKVAARSVINDPQLCKRFELEYTLVYPLSHRNLVKVLDYSEHEGVPFLVMEHVDGPSLAAHIEKKTCLSEHEALSILLPVADALTYLHGKNIIHRDIKPSNILMTADGKVKLADLGLVKDLDSTSRLTRTKTGLGTLQFASPEQFDNAAAADARSDIYSLAATVYMALTGEFPFGKGTVTSMMMRKLTNQFIAPIQKVPKLRPAVDAAIRMAMHAEAKFRPESVSDFVALLTGWKKYPADIELPGKMVEAAPVTKAPQVAQKAADERRKDARYELHAIGSCRSPIDTGGKLWASAIIDISKTGVCLQSKRRFDPGSVVEIMVSISPDESVITELARVRWNKPAEDKSWQHGCEFVNAMTQEEMESILANLKDKTKMH
jgi:serine/threonine protein kinase